MWCLSYIFITFFQFNGSIQLYLRPAFPYSPENKGQIKHQEIGTNMIRLHD